MADKISSQEFAAKIRAKYPGAYDNVSDDVLTQKVIAKYPVYAEQVQTQPAQAAPSPQAPEKPWYQVGMDEFKQAFSSPQAYADAVKKNFQTTKDFYGAIGEDLKGLATSPSTYLGPITGGAINAVQQLASGAPEPDLAHRVGGNLGINTQGVERDAAKGKYGAVIGHAALPLTFAMLGGKKGGEVVGETVKAAAENVPSPRGVLAERMAEVPPGEQFSRGEVNQSAREHGVNLDLAQATDHPVANTVKKVNQFSLAAKGKYEGAQQKNVAALESWADEQLSKMSPETTSREALGGQIQAALDQDLTFRKDAARKAFSELDERLGSNPIDTAEVHKEATKIVSENASYYDKHPELKPKQAWAIVKDLGEKGSNASWSELHQLRSDLMDFYRNNPDIIKGRGESWIQRMVSTIDNAMTNASGGMSADDLATFRRANDTWEGIKQSYDNPQSPLYHAIRGQFPSQIPGMLTKSPELAKQVRATLGSLEGPFQRQFVENILNSKDGQTLDLKNLNTKLSRIPNDILEAMVGQEGAKQLRLLGKVSQKVMADQNPSGTAKSTVPVLEVGNVLSNPAAGAATLAGQHVVGRAMNNPRVVDFLTMKPTDVAKMKMPKKR